MRPQIGRRIDVIVGGIAAAGFVGEPPLDPIRHPIEDRQQIVIAWTGRPQHRPRSGVLVGDDHTIGYDQVIVNISRRHLALRRRSDGWAVADLGSKNGILVNGKSVRTATP